MYKISEKFIESIVAVVNSLPETPIAIVMNSETFQMMSTMANGDGSREELLLDLVNRTGCSLEIAGSRFWDSDGLNWHYVLPIGVVFILLRDGEDILIEICG